MVPAVTRAIPRSCSSPLNFQKVLKGLKGFCTAKPKLQCAENILLAYKFTALTAIICSWKENSVENVVPLRSNFGVILQFSSWHMTSSIFSASFPDFLALLTKYFMGARSYSAMAERKQFGFDLVVSSTTSKWGEENVGWCHYTGFENVWVAFKSILPSSNATKLWKLVLFGLLCMSNLTCVSGYAESFFASLFCFRKIGKRKKNTRRKAWWHICSLFIWYRCSTFSISQMGTSFSGSLGHYGSCCKSLGYFLIKFYRAHSAGIQNVISWFT